MGITVNLVKVMNNRSWKKLFWEREIPEIENIMDMINEGALEVSRRQSLKE